MDRQLGWKKDKYDPRDYMHRMGVVKLPPVIDLSGLLPLVRNQLFMNACVGFGIGANCSGVAKAQNAYTEWYSPQWIWNIARFIEGTLTQNVGVEPGDALDGLRKFGCLLEQFWRFNDSQLDMAAPSSEREGQAFKYPDFTYTRVVNGRDGIMSALADGHLVSIGVPWFRKWMDDPPGGILPEVTTGDPFDGGHEVCIYKADQNAGLLWAQNSWGDWGEAGRFAFPFSAVDVWKQVGGYDAHYVTFTAPTAPPPAPQPEAVGCCKIGKLAVRGLIKAGVSFRRK